MRKTFLILLTVLAPMGAGAQQGIPPNRQRLPSDVRREVASRWNGENAVRSSERLEIKAGEEIRGDVSVQGAPITVAGHVTGNVLAVNTDVLLRPTARIDGELLVVGGDVEGRTEARVDGGIRIYRQSLDYRMEDSRLVVTDTSTESPGWWKRFEPGREGNIAEGLRVVQAGAYNRVEGLPISLGPLLRRTTEWGDVRLDPAAILRTGSSFSSSDPDVGYSVRAEIRAGHDNAIGFGGRLFSIVDPVEAWQMSNLEAALAAFVVRRDYRDYYQRHGGQLFVTLYGSEDFSVTGSYSDERWTSRTLRNPFTIFNGERPWRANPLVDEGRFHIGNLTARFDTRTDPDDPWSGWLITTELEHGRGTITTPAPASGLLRPVAGDPTTYTRAFLDLRRYNRLGPNSQLNMRVVLAGDLAGDELPLERRLSVDGPGVLPGFDFRSPRTGVDVGTCNAGLSAPGRPAECDRIALAQIEYRGDLNLHFTGDWQDWPRRFHSKHGDVVWVLFADAGRGWRTGPTDDMLTYARGIVPPLSTFRTYMGIGLDLAGIGIYASKSTSTPAEPVNFFVRLRHRF
jgi:hypothetical protein